MSPMCSPTYWILSQQGNRYIKTFCTLSVVRTMFFFYFTAVRYSLHKCSKTILCLKRQFTVCASPVSCALEFMETRKTFQFPPHSGQFITHERLAIKTVSSRLPRRRWSEARFVTLLGRISQMHEKRCQTNCEKGGDGVWDKQ